MTFFMSIHQIEIEFSGTKFMTKLVHIIFVDAVSPYNGFSEYFLTFYLSDREIVIFMKTISLYQLSFPVDWHPLSKYDADTRDGLIFCIDSPGRNI